MEDDVARPVIPSSVVDRVRDWLAWFGLLRLVTSAIAVVVVCGGAWWLMRSPVPPTESALPVATGASTAPAVTLPLPLGVDSADMASDEQVVVHVAGAVSEPGVYELPVGSRVAAAVAEAGGPGPGAEIDALNLAAVVADGDRIYVPTEGEASVSAATSVGPLDVNRASAVELESLPGVGPATAAAIVTERERNGPFASVADLERVPGIGPAKLAAISELVTS